MFRSPIFLKLYGGFVLIVLLTATIVWLVATRRVVEEGLADVRSELTVRSILLMETGIDFSAKTVDPALQKRVHELGRASGTRFTVIRQDGLVLADSWEDAVRMENHAERPEVREARTTGEAAAATRFSRTVRQEMMYLARPITRGGSLAGFVRAAVPLTVLEDRKSGVRENVATAVLISLLAALILGLLLARTYSRPVVEMTHVAESIAEGRHDHRLAPGGRDEIGKLGAAIGRMSEQLQERMETLTRERNRLHAILGGMLEGVIAVDSEERVVHMNQVAARLLRTSPEESAGRPIWELIRVQEVTDLLGEVLRDGEDHTREVRLPNGARTRVMELFGSPLRGVDGTVVGAVLVLHDVTELRRLEIVRREFVANVSHELKTPLTAIRGFVETLLDDAEMDEETRTRFLGRALDQSVRLSSLVNDLLILSRVESEEEALERRPIDLRATVREAVSRLAADVRGEGIELRVEVPEDPVEMLGDEESLRQAVDNLLDNAIKYTSEGGKVVVSLCAEDRRAIVSVTDTGIGIEERHLSRIFERFYRVDKARSRELGGTGLGLSIVKHIVNSHHGEVSVESTPGEGSVFRILLPLT